MTDKVDKINGDDKEATINDMLLEEYIQKVTGKTIPIANQCSKNDPIPYYFGWKLSLKDLRDIFIKTVEDYKSNLISEGALNHFANRLFLIAYTYIDRRNDDEEGYKCDKLFEQYILVVTGKAIPIAGQVHDDRPIPTDYAKQLTWQDIHDIFIKIIEDFMQYHINENLLVAFSNKLEMIASRNFGKRIPANNELLGVILSVAEMQDFDDSLLSIEDNSPTEKNRRGLAQNYRRWGFEEMKVYYEKRKEDKVTLPDE
jgi:hypothetical protein